MDSSVVLEISAISVLGHMVRLIITLDRRGQDSRGQLVRLIITLDKWGQDSRGQLERLIITLGRRGQDSRRGRKVLAKLGCVFPVLKQPYPCFKDFIFVTHFR